MQIKDLVEAVGIDPNEPLMDRILEHVGSMYTALCKPAEGLPFYLKSIEIQEQQLGKLQIRSAPGLLDMEASHVY